MTEHFDNPTAGPARVAAEGRGRRRWVGLVAVLAAAVLIAGACSDSSDSSDGASATTEAAAAPENFSFPGPYPVGRTELTLGDRKVWVFYPADPSGIASAERLATYSSIEIFPEALKAIAPPQLVQDIPLDAYRDAPASTEGPFPVVIHSHGALDHALLASRHLRQLASWGFVAAGPEYPESDLAASALEQRGEVDRVDVQARVLALLEAQNATGSLAGTMDLDRLAAEGLSAGGGAALRFAARPEVKTVIARVPVPPVDVPVEVADDRAARAAAALEAYKTTAPPSKPSMVITGEIDAVIPLTSVEATFAWLAAPKRFAVVKNAGHNSFTDFCAPIQQLGGLAQFAGQIAVPEQLLILGSDGCLPENLDAEKAYDIIDHLTVAQLRNVFGIDAAQAAASLERSYLDEQFPGALARYEYVP